MIRSIRPWTPFGLIVAAIVSMSPSPSGGAAMRATRSPEQAPSAPAVCVIDDSADMNEGADGLSRSPNGTWPILSYLFDALGCKRCCYWSAFDMGGVRCTTDAMCSERVPALKSTSPLVQTFAALRNYDHKDPAFFITNGLDWRTEGHDRSFRMDMDVGDLLAKWVTAKAERGVVLGVVQDNRHRRRRPNLVIGVLPESKTVDVCDSQPSNLPDVFSIRLQTFRNPEAVLEGGLLQLYPTLQLVGVSKLGTVQQQVTVGPDGVARVPHSFLTSTSDLKVTLTMTLKKSASTRFCWGMVATTGSSGTPLPSNCISAGGTVVPCVFTLPAYKQWVHGNLRLSLRTSPTIPAWIRTSVPDERHSLRRTLASLERGAEVPRRIRLAGSSALTIDSIVISADSRR